MSNWVWIYFVSKQVAKLNYDMLQIYCIYVNLANTYLSGVTITDNVYLSAIIDAILQWFSVTSASQLSSIPFFILAVTNIHHCDVMSLFMLLNGQHISNEQLYLYQWWNAHLNIYNPVSLKFVNSPIALLNHCLQC